MKVRVSGGIAVAGVFALGLVAFGQEAGQQPAQQQPAQSQQQPASQAQSDADASGQMTVTGCVQKESDYRQAHNAGRAGVAGSGIGAGNEFVLTNVSGAAASRAGAAAAFEMTGAAEGQLEQYIGRRVEVTGQIKAAETSGGQPTGGPTAGQPPRGVDVASEDLQLLEFEATSVKEASGTCPAAQ